MRRLFTRPQLALKGSTIAPPFCPVGVVFGLHQVRYAASLMEVNHYQRLQVEVSASSDDLKSAYRRLALQFHPDVAPEGKATAFEAEFRRISESYEFLRDETKRMKYDVKHGHKVVTEEQAVQSPVFSSSLSKAAKKAKRRSGFEPSRVKTVKNKSWRQTMVRGEAEEVFKSAFDGMSIDEVIFHARMRESQSPGDRTQPNRCTTPPPQYSANRGGGMEHPSNHMKFRPFLNMTVPEGVTHEGHVEPTTSVGTVGTDVPVQDVTDETLELSNKMPGWKTINELVEGKEQREMEKKLPHNMGQLWSWSRPY